MGNNLFCVAKPLPALAILGPTASGKTALALQLARQGWPVEIISLDSALVFCDMNIGTAKPTAAELAEVPHHLVNIISPEQSLSAAAWVDAALPLVHSIRARGRIPLVVGGTMMYYHSLVYGLDPLPQANLEVRAEIDALAAAQGWPAVHQALQQCDPITAARLKPTDAQRLQRALEVYRITGQPLSALQQGRQHPKLHMPTLVLLPGQRSALHHAIALRFNAMVQQGLLAEVQGLRQRYALHLGLPSMRCVGYRQAWQHLEGELSHDAFIEQGIVATRQLAKRQLTWLRSLSSPHFKTVDPQLEGWQGQALAWVAGVFEHMKP